MNRPEHQTLPVWLQAFNEGAKGTDWGGVMAGSTLMAIPVIIFFLLVQRRVAGRAHRRRGEGMNVGPRRRRSRHACSPRSAGRRRRAWLLRRARKRPRRRLPVRRATSSTPRRSPDLMAACARRRRAPSWSHSTRRAATSPASMPTAAARYPGNGRVRHRRRRSRSTDGGRRRSARSGRGRHRPRPGPVRRHQHRTRPTRSSACASFGADADAGRSPRRGLRPGLSGRRGGGLRQALPRPRRHRARLTPRAPASCAQPIDVAARERELVPFRAVVEAGVDAVMTAHVVVPAFDDGAGHAQPARCWWSCCGTSWASTASSSPTRSTWRAASRRRWDRRTPPCGALAAGADLLCLGSEHRRGDAGPRASTPCVGRRRRRSASTRSALGDGGERVAGLPRRASAGTAAGSGGLAQSAERGRPCAAGRRAHLATAAAAVPHVVELRPRPGIAAGNVAWGAAGTCWLELDPTTTVDRVGLERARRGAALAGEAGPWSSWSATAHRHPWQAACSIRLLAARPDAVVVDWAGPAAVRRRAPRTWITTLRRGRGASADAVAELLTRGSRPMADISIRRSKGVPERGRRRATTSTSTSPTASSSCWSAVGLRQVDAAADGRRAGGGHRRCDRHRRARRHRRRPEATATSPWCSRATRSTRT